MSKAPKKKAAKSKLIGKIVDEQPSKKRLKEGRFGEHLTANELLRSHVGANIQFSSLDLADVGFSTRAVVQANLPHSDPKTDVWVRQNGDFTLSIQSDIEVDHKTGQTKQVGIPYGTIPRLVLIYICSEAIKSKKRTVSLGDNLTDFMREIGLKAQGGKRGDITRLKEQMKRLVSAKIKFQYRNEGGEGWFNGSIAKGYVSFWDEKNPDQHSLFQSHVVLDADFFEEIIGSKVPLDLRAVAALKNNALGLDLYMWMTYRLSRLEKPVFIKWSDLMLQVGSDYSRVNDFQKKAKAILEEIELLWKDFKLETRRGGFMLHPIGPHIPTNAKPKALKG